MRVCMGRRARGAARHLLLEAPALGEDRPPEDAIPFDSVYLAAGPVGPSGAQYKTGLAISGIFGYNI